MFGSVELVEAAQEDGSVATVCRPSPPQQALSQDLFGRFARWAGVATAFLRRADGKAADAFAQDARNFGTYLLLQRIGSDISQALWRALFVSESEKILALLLGAIRANSDEFVFSRRTAPEVIDLEIEIDTAPEPGRYTVKARTAVGSAAARLTLPFDDQALEMFVLKHCNPRGAVRGHRPPTAVSPYSDFGGKMFDALFVDRVRELYFAARTHSRAMHKGLRIRLRHAGAPELAKLPWELLYDGTDFLFLDPKSALVRHIDSEFTVPAAETASPLRILVTVSSPDGAVALDTEAEIRLLRTALGPYVELGLIELVFSPDGKLSTLQRLLTSADRAGHPFHVWHFIGHGVFDEREKRGFLIFEADRGSRLVSGFELGTLFHNYDGLRLVVTNACETGVIDELDSLSGITAALVERGVPMVVAMQFRVSDFAALNFAGHFYAAVASGVPADVAVTEARRAIFFLPNYGEWATPVLYTRDETCRVLAPRVE